MWGAFIVLLSFIFLFIVFRSDGAVYDEDDDELDMLEEEIILFYDEEDEDLD